MRTRFIVALLLCAVLAVSAAGAPQSKGMGTIGGQVVGPDGKAVAGARVTLQGAEGRHPQTMETNEQGHFWFASLPEGLYDARAFYKGRVSEWRQNIWVSPGEQTNIVLHLRAKKSVVSDGLPSAAKPRP